MKTISIRQPWAWAIVSGHKPIENRNWDTKYRGLIQIHASKKDDPAGYEFLSRMGIECPENLPRGGIIGKVEIVDTVRESSSPWFFGKIGFVLINAVMENFRPVRGQLGIFEA